jgi:hypothetical protein
VTTPERTLADCIGIRSRFLRSVNLEKDYDAGAQNGDYIVTPTAVDILRRLAEGLSPSSTYRAWTITGPYGVGKSAFAVFLTRLLCQGGASGETAWKQLEQVSPLLAKDLTSKIRDLKGQKATLFPVLLTARRAPTALCLAEGLQNALPRLKGPQAKALASDVDDFIRDIRKGNAADSRRVSSLITAFAAAAQHTGYKGILLLVDELGKVFEFAARTPQRGDVFAMQEVAEQTSRSGAIPILFLGFLHQSFEDYGQHLDGITRKEWAKIHGRFEDIAFLEPPEQVIRMIAATMKWSPGVEPSPDLLRRVRQVAKACAECGIAPPGMRKSELEDLCVKAYPLHPLTLVALPFIFRRFAQNERSLFSYLSSREPAGFQEFLRAHTLSQEPEFVRLDSIFDHFTINFGTGLFRQPQARRWMEAADVLERKEGLSPLNIQLVKAIGVLGALGDFCHLRADERMISATVADAANIPDTVRDALRQLRECSILTYRAFNHTYRLWEGSDVDIDDRVAEGRRKVHGSVSLAAGIQKYLEPRPLVARRHSFEAGALRYFQTTYVDDPAQLAQRKPPAPGAAGQVVVCLSSAESQLQKFRDMAEAKEQTQIDLVIAIPQQIGELQTAVTELAAMRWAWDNTPELRDDRVARREIAMRMAEAEHFLQQNLGVLLDPRKEPLGSDCLWFWNGANHPMRSRVGVSHLLSTVSAKIYKKAPRIRNELIVRRTLSSAAAGARRDLVERMLTSADKPILGIEGFPPERSMYESVLKSTGLHREIKSGTWGFVEPPAENLTRLAPAWNYLQQTVFEAQGEPQPLDKLFAILSQPPYGVLDGLHPVLLCAFMRVYRDETTLYRENSFIPEPSVADFEVLMRRPELFAIAGSRMTGARAAVVERIAKSLGTPPATVPVVRALFRMVRKLPELACRTSRLSERARRVREAFDKAKVPERFLYTDLPVALGLSPFPDEGARKPDTDAFFKVLNECLQEWSGITKIVHAEARNKLLRACGFDTTDQGWQQLRETATRLEPRESDSQLRQLLRRIVESSADAEGVASVLALVSGRPPANWLDDDIARFPELAQAVGEPIRRAMARAGLCGEAAGALNGLPPQQRDRAKALARDLAKRFEMSRQKTAPDVMRAALLLLVDELVKGTGNTR